MRGNNFGLKIVSVIAAMMFVAACSTTPESSGDSSSTGGGSGSSSSSSASSGITPGSQKDLEANVGDRIFFGFDKYDLTDQARATLKRQAAFLQKYPASSVTVGGHCDERGTREYNLALGERRANSVKDYLTSLGIDPARVSTISYGKERPTATCSNESCWSKNRRAVTTLN